ncbi:rCG61733, isoform CRA_b [Rattus norvegicus]|nr:rCG61733, isoform CRA_b [Rattus norvegicus]
MRKLDKKCDENPRPFLAILVFKPHSSPCWKEGKSFRFWTVPHTHSWCLLQHHGREHHAVANVSDIPGSLGQAKGEVFYTGKSLHPRADLDMGELTRWAGALSL